MRIEVERLPHSNGIHKSYPDSREPRRANLLSVLSLAAICMQDIAGPSGSGGGQLPHHPPLPALALGSGPHRDA